MMETRTALVCGGGGFIGHHLIRRLKAQGFQVTGADQKRPRFSPTSADRFEQGDLRDPVFVRHVIGQRYDEVYQLAADMGGAGFVFSGENDADVMHNSALININVLERLASVGVGTVFYSSSACIYPERDQLDPNNPGLREASAYPAAPDSEYGWEKLFSERLYAAFARNKGLDVRIARFHNIFGPEGSWNDGREKSPAAICRKVAETTTGEVEIWGDGNQTRSFLFIDECLEGVFRLMRSSYREPVNIGSDEMVSINDLADLAAAVAGKTIRKTHVAGPLGVRGRNSDNRLIRQALGWAPSMPLRGGIEQLYRWIDHQVQAGNKVPA
jgi:nucleoside-diphosphate-sugar epimerase